MQIWHSRWLAGGYKVVEISNKQKRKSQKSFHLTFHLSSVLGGPQGLLVNAGEEVGELLER